MTEDERIDRAVDGRLEEEEWLQFQRDVIESPALRREYAERAALVGVLRADRERLARLLDETGEEREAVVRWLPSAWAAAAAALITALIAVGVSRSTSEETVAILVEAEGCRWAGSDLPTSQGARLGAGTLALVEGMATLQFESGARVTLEAPSTLEVLSKMRCRLVEGSLVADVPEPAHGFTIDTPELKVVDLGTRFGLTTSAFGHSHVLVFDGEVEVGRASEEPTRLTTGKALHFGHDAPSGAQEIARDPTPVRDPEGWTSISTGVGQGKDSYVRRGHSKPAGQDALLMVKHTDLAAGNERRAYLTFDLTSVSRGSLEEAELVLDVEASGLGFSALVPDSRFAVYGVLSDSLDEWEEETLSWDTAIAATDEGLIPAQTQLVGRFLLRRGAATAQVKVATQELVRFLREDGNGLASFIIIRETGETDQQGMVHAFAAKEHPEALPPTLRLKSS